VKHSRYAEAEGQQNIDPKMLAEAYSEKSLQGRKKNGDKYV
jgi:hypothetical protein